ncbi:family 10 glycosylhydrolase [Egicoccus sp. AB-alg6-2]|uniref:glycoside hydrolase family 10 protein n=1 Tax=Egicoccus sp. AB-alg6-2 TaxID=3242692 RepID=UPI00359E8815
MRRRWFALLVALALTAPVLGVGAPAHAATGTGACAGHLVPATAFTDTLASPHRAAIDCAVWWGMANGRSASRFDPAAAVTRGQTAAMIARLLRNAGRSPSEVASAGFPDTVGHVFERDIDALAALDIVAGGADGRFGPDVPVTRAQMSAILARTFANGFGAPLAAGPVPFRDVPVDNVHRAAIGQLVGAGIVAGTTPTTFAPSRAVSREQMASFTTRSAHVLLAGGLVRRPATRPAADDAYASRMRGAWVHLFDDALKTRAGVRAVVDELAAADANVIIAQVARRHDAYYDSSVLPRTADPRLARDFDVLAELITAAHARGIEVHAWFGVAPTWHDVYRGLPAPAGWMHTTHGLGAPVDRRWVTRTSDGSWTSYLDPGVPAVRQHVAAVVGELARNYAVDGIHLDYVRYESPAYGYNPLALAAFRRDTGATGTPANNDAAFTAWRRDQTRRIVLAAREAIRASGRDVTLSAAVITWGAGPRTHDAAGFRQTLPYTRTLQDWDGWVRRGEVDAVVPMNYFRAHEAEPARWFDAWLAYERALAATTDVQVVPGPAGYLNRPAAVHRQVTTAMRVDGAVIYSYQQPTEDASRAVWGELARSRWHYAPIR